MRCLSLFFVLTLGFATSCATTPAKPAGKPYENCLCGPTLDLEGKPFCAIWGEAKNPSQALKVWESDPRANCEANDCSQLFSKFCQKIQMSGLTQPNLPPPSPTCYCDAVLLENDKGAVQLYCAAWAENSKNLIEYYALDDCSPQRCRDAPFNKSAKICSNSFKPFYSPLLNRR